MRPVDQQHRDRIRGDISDGLFVEAGAGTGKTTALVGRILTLIRNGIPLKSIAAITFTNKAAGELRDRLRRELEQATTAEDDVDARQRLEAALDDLEVARIETIHGFALRLLMDYPLQAGLPPALSLLEEFRGVVAFEEWWNTALSDLLTDEALKSIWPNALDAGLTTKYLKSLALFFDENWHRLDAELKPSIDIAFVEFKAEVVAAGRAVAQRREECTDETDIYSKKLVELAEWVQSIENAAGVREVMELSGNWPINQVGGLQRSWVDLHAVKAAVAEYKLCTGRLSKVAADAIFLPLIERLRVAVLARAAARHGAGTLTFHDVLVLTRNLLWRSEEARQDVRARIQRLMIDEFQDTDPLQMEIAGLIVASEPPGLDFDWRTAALDKERLFFVGDPKQSIYRFRGADVSIYSGAQQLFRDETRVPLTVNFRSRHGILRWINVLFAPLFASLDGQVPYTALECPLESEEPTVLILGGPKADGVDRSANKMRADEAGEIAETVFRARTDGWLVGRALVERPVRYEDMAILIPTRTCLSALETALTALKIPYRIECQSLLWASREAREIIEAMTALNDPGDAVAVVSALRSSLFGCTDTDLLNFYDLNFHQPGQCWNYESQENRLLSDSPVECAFAALRKLRILTRRMPANQAMDTLLRERSALEAAFSFARPRDTWQRQRLLLDQARAFEAEEGGTLGQFLTWARMQQAAEVRQQETVVAEADDDAVRILTIHAAKGLEFPIVFLAGLGTGKAHGNAPAAYWTEAGKLEINIGPISTPGVAKAKKENEAHEAHENIRLLYVAATRAQDYLVVSLHHNHVDTANHAQASNAKTLYAYFTEAPELKNLHATSPRSRIHAPTDAANLSKHEKSREAWCAETTDLAASLLRMPALAATTIAAIRAADNATEPKYYAHMRGRAGTGFGRAVHAALQTVDLSDPDAKAIDALAKLGATGEGIPDQESEIAEAIRRALSTPIVAEASKRKFYREVFLSACCQGVAVEGFLDLVFQDDAGEWVVVDYKTDHADDPAQTMTRYAHQAAVYALLVRERLGKLPARCIFLFVNAPSHKAAVTVDNLEARVRDLETWLTTGGWK